MSVDIHDQCWDALVLPLELWFFWGYSRGILRVFAESVLLLLLLVLILGSLLIGSVSSGEVAVVSIGVINLIVGYGVDALFWIGCDFSFGLVGGGEPLLLLEWETVILWLEFSLADNVVARHILVFQGRLIGFR